MSPYLAHRGSWSCPLLSIAPQKICDWPLNSSQDHFSLHEREKRESGLRSLKGDLGKPTYTLIPCWIPKPLPPRNQCTGWFAPGLIGLLSCLLYPLSWSHGFCGKRGKRGSLNAKAKGPWQRNATQYNFIIFLFSSYASIVWMLNGRKE